MRPRRLEEVEICTHERSLDGEGFELAVARLPLAELHRTLERRLETGARPDARTLREWRVVEPRLGPDGEPLHAVGAVNAAPSLAQPALFGSAGAAKASSSGADGEDGAYGEDVCSCFTLELPPGLEGFSVDLLFEADGHGGRGVRTALQARALFERVWTDLAPEICRLTQEGQTHEACSLMQRRGYDEVLRAVETEAKQSGWTGSTVTQMLTVTLPNGRRVAYSSNMGDSPGCVIVLRGGRATAGGPKVFVTTSRHSWEDQDEMRRYVRSVWAARERARAAGEPYEDIKPRDVCYHTFNCAGERAVLEDVDGNKPGFDERRRRWVPKDARPIKMWNYLERRDPCTGVLAGWEPELDRAAQEHVWRAAAAMYGESVLGGIQAPAAKQLLVAGPDARPLRPLAPHENWGSVVLMRGGERGCQVTRGLADFEERRSCYTCDQASWQAFEIRPDEEVVQVVMSDGVGDMLGLQELAERLVSIDADSLGQRFADAAIEATQAACAFRRDPATGRLRPEHDDCSVAIAYRPANDAMENNLG